MAVGGLDAFLAQFGSVLKLLADLPAAEADTRESSVPGAATTSIAEATTDTAAQSSSAASTPDSSPAALYRASVVGLMSTFLVMMTNLTHASMIATSPNAAVFLGAELPAETVGVLPEPAGDEPAAAEASANASAGAGQDNDSSAAPLTPFAAHSGAQSAAQPASPAPAAPTSPAPAAASAQAPPPGRRITSFMEGVWGKVVAAVLPTLRDPDLAAAHPTLAPMALSVLRNCGSAEGRAALASRRSWEGILHAPGCAGRASQTISPSSSIASPRRSRSASR